MVKKILAPAAKVLRPAKRFMTDFFDAERTALVLTFVVMAAGVLMAQFEHSSNIYETIKTAPLPGHMTMQQFSMAGLVSVIFLLIGMELAREMRYGNLASRKDAAGPVIGALGGMFAPALVAGVMLWIGGYDLRLAAIPTATDIPLVLAASQLTLSATRHTYAGNELFMKVLAVADDVGAVLVIGVLFTSPHGDVTTVVGLLICLEVFAILRWSNAENPWLYMAVFPSLWYFMHHAGIEPALAGFITGMLMVPQAEDEHDSAFIQLEHRLARVVAFVVIPLFIFVNIGVKITPALLEETFTSWLGWSVFLGLVLGKRVGIFYTLKAAVQRNWASMPSEHLYQVRGYAQFGGIGFTMALFVASLACNAAGTSHLLPMIKVAIFAGSITSALIGFAEIKIGDMLLERELSQGEQPILIEDPA